MFNFKLVKKSEYESLSRSRETILNAHNKLVKDLEFEKSLGREKDHQIELLRVQVDRERYENLLDIDLGDPTPDKPEARREYVARVAGFYKDTLKPKCLQMVSVFHRLLEEETNDRETDLYLKMGTYICREFMKWGDQAINEQMAYQNEKPETPEQKKDTINSTVIL